MQRLHTPKPAVAPAPAVATTQTREIAPPPRAGKPSASKRNGGDMVAFTPAAAIPHAKPAMIPAGRVPYDPAAEARIIVLDAYAMQVEPDTLRIAELTGFSKDDVQRFIEHTLLAHTESKQSAPAAPVLRPGPAVPKEKKASVTRTGKERKPLSEQAKANMKAGRDAYFERKRQEKRPEWSGGIAP